MTIITRMEVHRILQAIAEVDPQLIFYIQTIKEVKGDGVKSVGSIYWTFPYVSKKIELFLHKFQWTASKLFFEST